MKCMLFLALGSKGDESPCTPEGQQAPTKPRCSLEMCRQATDSPTCTARVGLHNTEMGNSGLEKTRRQLASSSWSKKPGG